MFAVIHQVGGILEGVSLFEDREAAIAYGKQQWGRISGDDALMQGDQDYDPDTHGVARGYTMAWHGDSWDVWVTVPDHIETAVQSQRLRHHPKCPVRHGAARCFCANLKQEASTPHHPAEGGSRAAGPMFPAKEAAE